MQGSISLFLVNSRNREDGQAEQDEVICWKATLAPNSTASLPNEHFLLRLDDSGLDGGGKLRCVRGRECAWDETKKAGAVCISHLQGTNSSKKLLMSHINCHVSQGNLTTGRVLY